MIEEEAIKSLMYEGSNLLMNEYLQEAIVTFTLSDEEE